MKIREADLSDIKAKKCCKSAVLYDHSPREIWLYRKPFDFAAGFVESEG